MGPENESQIFGDCAREKGYNSVQFEPMSLNPVATGSDGTGWNIGLTELVIVDMEGKHNCGTADGSQTLLRSGWMASQQCECEALTIPETCGLIGTSTPWDYTPP